MSDRVSLGCESHGLLGLSREQGSSHLSSSHDKRDVLAKHERAERALRHFFVGHQDRVETAFGPGHVYELFHERAIAGCTIRESTAGTKRWM
jgi:hypothetical protein